MKLRPFSLCVSIGLSLLILFFEETRIFLLKEKHAEEIYLIKKSQYKETEQEFIQLKQQRKYYNFDEINRPR